MKKQEEPVYKEFVKIDKTKITDLKEYIQEQLSSHRAQLAGDKMSISIGTDSKFHPRKGAWSVSYGTVIAFTFGNTGTHLVMKKSLIRGEGKLSMFNRLWREVEITIDLGVWLRDELGIVPEIHLDINPDKAYKSNVIHDAAIGYVESMGFNASSKPFSQIASCASDHFVRNKMKR